MFSFFAPKCPLETSEKVWLEFRLSDLIERFGLDQFRSRPTILPTAEFFPLPFRGSKEEVQAVFETVCGHFQADPKSFRLEIFDPEAPPTGDKFGPESRWKIWEDRIYNNAFDESDPTTIFVSEILILDLETLIAIFARELSRSFLVAAGASAQTEEFEHNVELMPLFFGYGIFAANAVLRDASEILNGWHTMQLVPQGLLPSRYIGFALGVLCWRTGKFDPPWRRHLRRDAEGTLRETIRYLKKTGDTILSPDRPKTPYWKQSAEVWQEDLRSDTDGVRLAALSAMLLADDRLPASRVVPDVTAQLQHRDYWVRAYAAKVLDAIGKPARSAISDLLTAVEDRSRSVKMFAALALGKMTEDGDRILPTLIPMLLSRDLHVANAAAWSVGQFGSEAEAAAENLVLLLRRVVILNEIGGSEDIVHALLAVTDHPEEVITETLIDRDAETCQRILDYVSEIRVDRDHPAGNSLES